jgi:membrane protein DedA with SNARE-associated domain
MISASLVAVVVYLLLGFLASFLLRKGRPEDWDESLLASVVALPMVILIALVVLARRARHLMDGGSGPAAAA